MTLDDYQLEYEDQPLSKLRITRKGGKDMKMSKAAKTNESPAKVYAKTRGEHFKDMVIVALVVSIIGFVGGMQFQKSHDTEVRNAMAQSQTVATDTPVKK